MKRILINFAHPNPTQSRINSAMISEIKKLPEEVASYITINDLYHHYPDFNINAKREKKLLIAHDVILFHHPLYWYSAPAIIKEWQDTTLEYSFAYGPNGDALKGKITQNIISTGGEESSYKQGGYNNFTIEELLYPFEQTAKLCQMEYLKPLKIHSAASLSDEQIKEHASKYKEHILQLINS
jgi:glutathione-regulated potassium-efflux system ancillary protein KefG